MEELIGDVADPVEPLGGRNVARSNANYEGRYKEKGERKRENVARLNLQIKFQELLNILFILFFMFLVSLAILACVRLKVSDETLPSIYKLQ